MRASSRKLVIGLLGLVILGLIVYFSRGFIHLQGFSGKKLYHAVRNANPYLLIFSIVAIYVCYGIRALRWKLFQGNLGPARFWPIYAMTLAGFSAVFLLGRAGEPVRPALIARKEGLPFADMFGIYFLERLFDFASTAVIASIALLLFKSHAPVGQAASTLEAAAKTTGTLLSAGVLGAIAFLVYLRMHGTALLERRLQGWHAAHGWRSLVARILLGFVRGVQAIRSVGELAAAVSYSAVHWFLVLMVYLGVSRAFGGPILGAIGLGDAMLVLAFTLVGSAVQVPTVGGGAQAATFLVYARILGVDDERALAGAIVLWLISFAACSLAGVPLLLREGFSPGKLRELAQHEKQEMEV
jgi:glycosyltransferase 2 family protein